MKTTEELKQEMHDAFSELKQFQLNWSSIYGLHWSDEVNAKYVELEDASVEAVNRYQERLRQEAEAGRSFQPPQATNSFRWDF